VGLFYTKAQILSSNLFAGTKIGITAPKPIGFGAVIEDIFLSIRANL
jgi:hypothetical protein